MRTIWTIALAATLVLTMACGGDGGEVDDSLRQAALSELQQAKSELDAKRQELQELMAQATAGEDGEPAADDAEGEGEGEGEGGEDEGPDLETRIATLEKEVLDMADAFGGSLVEFINADPPIVGEPMSEIQQAAMRMKSDEDIVLAQTYIDDGGDYKRAIRIYEAALAADPDNEKLMAAKAAAEELRFMTEERFDAVSKGMTQDEVRATLGQVNLRNRREYEDKDVIAWFYPKAEDGSAAGVFFRKRGGEYKVYETDFDAVKARAPEGADTE